MRETSSETQTAFWKAVHNKIVPVDARSTWFEAVHHVEEATGVVVTEATIIRPRIAVDGARGQAAVSTIAVVVQHLAATRSATVTNLRLCVKRRRVEVPVEEYGIRA
jgi:hypothetical protein